MAEYYFDVETTGKDFDTDEIITIQWQRLNGFTGESMGCCLWGLPQDPDKPKPKSNQQRLRDIFGDRSE